MRGGARRYRGRVPSATDGGASFESLLWALALVGGGRALLALLPVGDAGMRRPFDAVGSLAPSALAAVAAALLCGALSASDGLAPFATLTTWVLGGALLVALAARALGPAGLVPRHPRVEVPPPRPAYFAMGVLLYAAVAHGEFVWAVLGALLLEGGLERLALAPRARRVWALAALLVLLGSAHLLNGLAPALAIGCAAHAAGWIRRADRRDLALAGLCAAALAVATSPAVGALAALALIVCTPRPRLALVPVSAALVATLALALASDTADTHAARFAYAGLVALAATYARISDRSRA